MAIYGIRKKGTDIDIATIQVRNNRMRKSNAEKSMEAILYERDLPASEYETHFLWFE